MTHIKYADRADPDFISLCSRLDDYLDDLAAKIGITDRSEYIPHNRPDELEAVFVAYEGGIPVGCAAFKNLSPDTAEVKRVFVAEEYRGRRIGELLMSALENKAISVGYRFLVLETGEPLTAAIKLYARIGFGIIENYGPYVGMPHSTCMKKPL